jgi:hypothetical protein
MSVALKTALAGLDTSRMATAAFAALGISKIMKTALAGLDTSKMATAAFAGLPAHARRRSSSSRSFHAHRSSRFGRPPAGRPQMGRRCTVSNSRTLGCTHSRR